MTSSVLFETMATVSAKKIAIATLNRPQTLNGLSLEMSQLLYTQLVQWQEDRSVALIILKGAGEKSFCAGGDLLQLYKTMQGNRTGRPWDNVYARNFFEVEYRLDYLIHTYTKPILCWGSGIVMGGGAGLMMGASHRVVSETTRFAMPEISIGLFPDVGGTWMLSHLPGGIGLFLGLTGAQLGTSDCRFLGLADYTLDSASWHAAIAAVQAQSWSDSRADNDIRLHHALRALEPQTDLSPGPLQIRYSLINQLCSGPDFDAICANIAALVKSEDTWLARAANTFRAGSPGSARLCFELLRRVRRLSLAEVFQQEYIVSLQCGVQGDFQEGIRALLIDKDKSPRWSPATLAGASEEWVQRFFVPGWPDSEPHPLADLGWSAASGKRRLSVC
ncbi:MAG TPA: enoyl-CoA hydratase/isomerase family protein [Eoetvoesiella sp.]